VVITKEQQIDHRRQTVFELSSQGLTQQEIASKSLISQKTVSNDLAFLRKEAIEFVKKNRENVVFGYQRALSNFYQMRKEAVIVGVNAVSILVSDACNYPISSKFCLFTVHMFICHAN
jgi:DNA-binding transcriptional regulator LsrR (DeoR family)